MQPRRGWGQNLAIEGEAEGARKFCEKKAMYAIFRCLLRSLKRRRLPIQ
jgi:hypothetical protein